MKATVIKRRAGDTPALMKCVCGTEFYFQGNDLAECECPGCMQVYNPLGQPLKGFTQPFNGMNEWGEYYDEN